ncbi:MAG: hypothetical protein RR490_08385 [Niameybacter sp.]
MHIKVVKINYKRNAFRLKNPVCVVLQGFKKIWMEDEMSDIKSECRGFESYRVRQ